ncbi:hypothetical protein AB3N58_10135 [Leptospira sp. WS60.C2]
MNNLLVSLERIEKRLVTAICSLIVFSILLLYLVSDAFITHQRVKYYEELENINIDFLNLENQKSIILEIIDNTNELIENKQKIIYFDSLGNNCVILIMERKKLIELLDGNKNFLDFTLNENGEYQYSNKKEVNEFWAKINKKNLPIYHEILKESLYGINFKSIYDELNKPKITSVPVSPKKEIIQYETILKMQNFFASLKEIDHRIDLIYKMDLKRIDIKSKYLDDPEIKENILSLEKYHIKLDEINSKIKESLKLQFLKLNNKGKNDILSKNFQSISVGSLSFSLQTILYFYPIALILSFHWILLNFKRFEFLLSFLKAEDEFYSNMFLNYTGKYSIWTSLLIILLPTIVAAAFMTYVYYFSDYYFNYNELFLFRNESLLLLLFILLSLLISIYYLTKITDLIVRLRRNKILK